MQAQSTPIRSSSTSGSRDGTTATGPNHKPKTRGKKGAWLTSKAQKLAGWLATSEPSAQALNQHRKEAFQKAGICLNEAEPHSKLHAPIGGIPPDAIQPSSGPSPEELLQKRARERRTKKQKHLKGPMSSTDSSIYSDQGSTSLSFNIFPNTGTRD